MRSIAILFVLLPFTLAAVGGCGDDDGAPATETVCGDGADNDDDGDTDCDDDDCAAAPVCLPESDCGDGADNDADGDTDCDDDDCATDPVCAALGTTCSAIQTCAELCSYEAPCVATCRANGCLSGVGAYTALQSCLFNECVPECLSDQSSQACTNCSTLNCAAPAADCAADNCQGPFETLCTGGVDDDGDGDVDCADVDCATNTACGGDGVVCSELLTCREQCSDLLCLGACRVFGCPTAQLALDIIDGCASSQCATECLGDPTSQTCVDCVANNCSAHLANCAADTCTATQETICDDGIDNDGDNDTDCADADCVGAGPCLAPLEHTCDDGLDEDGDGDVDCADADCTNASACGGSGWSCSQIFDCVVLCDSDPVCIAACWNNACPSTQTTYGDTEACLINFCSAECASDRQSPTCDNCLQTNCTASMNICAGSSCP